MPPGGGLHHTDIPFVLVDTDTEQIGNLQDQFGEFPQLLVLALIRNSDSSPIYNPDRSMILAAGDILILQADVDSLRRFRNKHT